MNEQKREDRRNVRQDVVPYVGRRKNISTTVTVKNRGALFVVDISVQIEAAMAHGIVAFHFSQTLKEEPT